MKTYSHLLITAVLDYSLKSRGTPVHTKALLLGSVMPDIPLLALTAGFIARRSWSGLSAADDPICGPHFNHLYFHHPVWGIGHNLFHAPLLLGWIGWWGYRSGGRRGALFWFALACGLHSLLDIFTHHTDGPLLLFPLNWRYRFPAPLSYWDPEQGGQNFARFERLLNLALGVYLLLSWFLGRKSSKPECDV
ncbi:MAG: metal-dependent hydrolase [Anaerolineales bacterium]|nr:metal-dependent hydrolase [Anaerolineales bacterium]